jgi:4a-hydroxytetrahydrobiopterin dehydratase
MAATRLTADELAAALASLPDWRVIDGSLHREFRFEDFTAAWAFMNRVAAVAEELDHHPDWSNSWATVVIDLCTHSAGGLTGADVDLARRIDQLV